MDTNLTKASHPLNILKKITCTSDFVAFKLDIDSPGIEQAIIQEVRLRYASFDTRFHSRTVSGKCQAYDMCTVYKIYHCTADCVMLDTTHCSFIELSSMTRIASPDRVGP